MIRSLVRKSTIALVCSALLTLLVTYSFVQTTSENNRSQVKTEQQVLFSWRLIAISSPALTFHEIMPVAMVQGRFHEIMPALMIQFQIIKVTPKRTKMADTERKPYRPHDLKPMLPERANGSLAGAARQIGHETNLIPVCMLAASNSDNALSRAEKNTRDGQGTLERSQQTVTTLRL